MKRLTFIASAILTVFALSGPASAIDIVNRKSDKAAQGDITTISRTSISVKSGIGTMIEVPANDIISVRWGAEPPELNLARAAEDGGNLQRALEQLATSAGGAGTNEAIKAEIQYLVARVTARLALEQDASKLPDASAKLDGFLKANGDNFRYFDALQLHGTVQLASEDYPGAEQSFSKLAQAPWPDYKMAAQNASAKLAFQKNDLPGALSAYEQVLSLNASTPGEISRRNEALLGKASVQLKQGNADLALQAVAEAITKTDPEDSAVQAVAWNLKGECLKTQGKVKESILAYLHVPVLFEREKVQLAEALYNLAILWPRADEPERGLAARQELEESYPDSPWTKKLP
ncbi:MAG: tetratricopeptide repeat protein [Planctomycetota bacterium]|nr:tetratricopeptide repeat protein [Planctomycetota bacterium]